MVNIITVLSIIGVLGWLFEGHWLLAIIGAVCTYFWINDTSNYRSYVVSWFTKLKDKIK